ncbi:MAG: Fur family transcriptional regulator [Propionivibrio sp.]
MIRAQLLERLKAAGVQPTLQRLAVAEILFDKPAHLRADEIVERVQQGHADVSRATVYNTLKLFRDAGLIRELIVDGGRIVFDSNVAPHYHLYDVDSGAVVDVPEQELKVVGRPTLPPGCQLVDIDVIVRVRGIPAELI